MIKRFNEAFGINKDLISQVEEYWKRITSTKSNDFIFNYTSGGKTISFELSINPNFHQNGEMSAKPRKNKDDIEDYNFIINLNKKDFNTLLHEVKHIDFFMRVYNTELMNPNSSIKTYHKLSLFIKKLEERGVIEPSGLGEIFYLIAPNEFQARLIELYSKFKKYLIDNNIKESKANLELHLYKYILNNDEEKYTFIPYISIAKDSDFKLEKICDKDIIDEIFSLVLAANWKSVNQKSIDALVRKTEKNVHKRAKVYYRKIMKLITLLYEETQ